MHIQPHYPDENCVLYNADCRRVLPYLGVYDLLLTDPPYGINRDKGMGGGGFCGEKKYQRRPRKYAGEWDSDRPPRSVIELAMESARTHIIWGGQFFANMLSTQGKWLFWDKQQTMHSFGAGELAWTDLPGTAIRKFTLSMNKINGRKENGLHPTQKPVDLMRWCLSLVPNALSVIDPVAGSGSTGVACKLEGRKVVMVESSTEYCDIAAKRLEETEFDFEKALDAFLTAS